MKPYRLDARALEREINRARDIAQLRHTKYTPCVPQMVKAKLYQIREDRA
jgi:hypothetical protein